MLGPIARLASANTLKELKSIKVSTEDELAQQETASEVVDRIQRLETAFLQQNQSAQDLASSDPSKVVLNGELRQLTDQAHKIATGCSFILGSSSLLGVAHFDANGKASLLEAEVSGEKYKPRSFFLGRYRTEPQTMTFKKIAADDGSTIYEVKEGGRTQTVTERNGVLSLLEVEDSR